MRPKSRPFYRIILILPVFLFLFKTSPAWCMGPRPLETEEAWPIEKGTLQLSIGFEYQDDNVLPFSTRDRDREFLRLPLIGAAIGIGERVELQALYDVLTLENDVDESGSGDLRLATKVGIIRESVLLPALGLRFGTKLPNANSDDRLGTDETDFFASVLLTRTLALATMHINAGIAILGDPRPGGGQDDVFSYGIAIVVPTRPLELVVEINGQAFSQENNDRAILRGGTRWNLNNWVVLDLGAGIGLNDDSEDWSVPGRLRV
jgi:hypothetical protein